MNLENFISDISNEILKECFEEIRDYRKTGILKENGAVRKINSLYEEKIGYEYPAIRIEQFILFEISRRWYDTYKN